MRSGVNNIVTTYRIALVQMASTFLNRDANLEKAETMLREAAANGAKLVCFPESFDIGYINDRLSEMCAFVQPEDDTTLVRMCALANELGIWILAPVFMKNKSGEIENRACLIDNGGRLLGSYSKTHLTVGERRWLTRGTEYPVFETDLGKIGISICYDLCFPEVGRLLAMKGAEVILVPAAWRDGGNYSQWWEINVGCRALDNLAFVAAVNMTGVTGADCFLGRSQLCGPDGSKLCECGKDEETILYGQIDLNRIREEQSRNTVLADRHPGDYRLLCE